MPTLRQLEYLVAVADTLHFRRAAERVNTTQPTLSEQLKALEDRLGTQLVERNRARVVLTPVGLEIVGVARRILRDAGDIRSIAQAHSGSLSGVIRLGASPTIGAYMLSRMLPAFHQQFPRLKMHVREDAPQRLMRGLDEGTYDLVIAPQPLRGTDFEVETIFREAILVAVASDHPLASKQTWQRRDLVGLEVLTLGAGYHLHDLTAEIAREVGARLRHDYEGTSLDTLREMVATGLGITFLPELYVRTVVTRDPLIKTGPVQDLKADRIIAMAWRKTTSRQSMFRQIAELARHAIVGEARPEPVGE
jgi:LysR family hydrogen peroxide-inducible transcriptional activator